MGSDSELEQCPTCGSSDSQPTGDSVQTHRCRDCGLVYYPENLRKQDPRVNGDPTRIEGTPLSNGVARGTVIIQPYGQVDNEKMATAEDAIVVVDSLSPDFLNRIENIAGLVTESGGPTSRGGVVSRKLEVPAIGHCPGGFSFLEEGQFVELNGAQGVLRLLDDSQMHQ